MIHGSSIISYKLNGVLYTESVRDAFTRVARYSGNIYGDYNNPEKNTVDCAGKVQVLDYQSGNYVDAYNIRKEFKKELFDVVFDNARYITVSADQEIVTNGSTPVNVQKVNNSTQVINMAYPIEPATYDAKMNTDFAWTLGALFAAGEYRNNPVITLYKNDEKLSNSVKLSLDRLNGIGNSGNVEKAACSCKVTVARAATPRVTIASGEGKYSHNNAVKSQLLEMFGSLNKSERKIPQCVFSDGRFVMVAFIMGMVDTIGTIIELKQNKYDIEMVLPADVAQQVYHLLWRIDIPSSIEYGTDKNGVPSGKDTLRVEVAPEFQKFTKSSLFDGKTIEYFDRFGGRYEKVINANKVVRILKHNDVDFYNINTRTESYSANGISVKSDGIK